MSKNKESETSKNQKSEMSKNNEFNVKEFMDFTNMTCRICNKSYTSFHNIKRHIKAVHFQIKDHSCTQCERKFAERAKLKEHYLKGHHHTTTTTYSRDTHSVAGQLLINSNHSNQITAQFESECSSKSVSLRHSSYSSLEDAKNQQGGNNKQMWSC